MVKKRGKEKKRRKKKKKKSKKRERKTASLPPFLSPLPYSSLLCRIYEKVIASVGRRERRNKKKKREG